MNVSRVTVLIPEWLITCWRGWKTTSQHDFSLSTAIFVGLSISQQQLHNARWRSICSPRLQLCVKRLIQSCQHLEGNYGSAVCGEAKEHVTWRGKARSLKFPSVFIRSSSSHLFTSLHFRHQAHVSRTDVIYQGSSLQQPTRLCLSCTSRVGLVRSTSNLWWHPYPNKKHLDDFTSRHSHADTLEWAFCFGYISSVLLRGNCGEATVALVIGQNQ